MSVNVFRRCATVVGVALGLSLAASTASATAITGVTNISGSVNVGNNAGVPYIDFFGTAIPCATPGVGVPGCFTVNAASTGSFPSPGPAAGTVRDLLIPPFPPSGTVPLAVGQAWMTFIGGAGVIFDLTYLTPGSAVNCATLSAAQLATPNQSCSAYFGGTPSPLTLTNDATASNVAVRMSVLVDGYTGTRASGFTPYQGIYTTQVQGNLGQVLTAAATPAGIAPTGTSYSANFSPVPEPGTVGLALMGVAMIATGLYRRRQV